MKKRILSLLLTLLLIISSVPLSALPVSAAIESGTCGDNVTWTLDTDTGVFTVSGTGEMADYYDNLSLRPWNAFMSDIKHIIIEDGVTSIGDAAFIAVNAYDVSIPDSVKSIGYVAFANCNYLSSIDLGDGIETIESCAFLLAIALEAITLPASLKDIESSAFSGCSSLKNIVIPDSVTSIGDSVFDSCSSLASVTIGSGVTSIGNYAFSSCSSLTDITIPDSVTSIGASAFFNCTALESVTIGSGVTSIGNKAFYGCSSLTGVTYNSTKEQWNKISIGTGNDALIDAYNESYPDNDDDIITWSYDSETKTLTIPGSINMTDYSTEDPAPWNEFASEIETVIINDGVTSVGAYSFYGCTQLTSVVLPESITKINNSAFQNCSSLVSINIPAQVTTIGYRVFYGCTSLTEISIPNGVSAIKAYAFTNCSSLNSIILPDSITIIDVHTFENCSSLNSIIIPQNVKRIVPYAFYRCSSLASIDLPVSVTFIGNMAFSYCNSLAEVNYAGTPEQWDLIQFDGSGNDSLIDAYNKQFEISGTCGDSLTWKINIITGSLIISGTGEMTNFDSFEATPWYEYKNSIKSVVVEPGVTSIGENAFNECSAINNITIPASVTAIGTNAFASCDSLSEVTYEDTYKQWLLIEIGSGNDTLVDAYNNNIKTSGAFGDTLTWNYNLEAKTLTISGDGEMTDYSAKAPAPWSEFAFEIETVIINDGVTIIGDSAFSDCSSLTSVTIPDGVTSIGDSTFSGCSALTSITIPESVTIIEPNAFENCSSLNSITIPQNVKSIYPYAFSGCSSLASIDLPVSVTFIGNMAFSYCNSLAEVNYAGTLEQWCLIQFDGSGNDSLIDAYNKQFETCGDNLIWKINVVTGSLIISGTGEMTNFDSFEATPWYEYKNSIKSVVVKPGVTSIGSYAFCSSSIETVELPESVVNIGNAAFSQCYSLTEVTIPGKIKNLGASAFRYCTSLESVSIRNNEYTFCIGDYAFAYCSSLTDVVIKDAKSIGIGAFQYCSSLKDIRFPHVSNYTMSGSMFQGCSALETIFIRSSTKTIEALAFSDCSNLKTVTYNGTEEEWNEVTINTIGNDPLLNAEIVYDNTAYSIIEGFDCKFDPTTGTLTISGTGSMQSHGVTSNLWHSNFYNYLRHLVIEEGITGIPGGTFGYYTCIETVTIPASLTTIGQTTFVGNSTIKSFNVHPDNPVYTSVDGVLYSKDMKTLIKCPGDKTNESFIIPDGVTTIKPYAFGYCGMQSLTIPASVEAIESYAFYSWMLFAGDRSVRIKNINVKDLSAWCNIEFGEEYSNPLNNSENLYLDGELVTDLVIPEDITEIPSSFFSGCDSIETVTFHDGITSIGDSAFAGCSALTSVTVPNATLGTNIFSGCSSLSDVIIADGVTSIPAGTFSNCSALTSVTFPESLKTIGSNAFDGCSSLTSVTLPNVSLGGSLFADCSSLETVVIADGVKSIPGGTFANCSSLATVTIPVSVTSIGNNAFAGCSALETVNYAGTEEQFLAIDISSAGNSCLTDAYGAVKIVSGTFGEGLTWTYDVYKCILTIGGTGDMPDFNDDAYDSMPWKDYLSSIKSIVIEEGVTRVGAWAFIGSGTKNVSIADSVTTIGQMAFAYGGYLNNIELGDGIETIEAYAFAGAEIEVITLPDSVKYIGEYAFSNCQNLSTVTYKGTEEEWNAIDISSIGNESLFNAEKIFSLNSWGENLIWTFDEATNTLTISGTGDMQEIEGPNTLPWLDCLPSIENVIIEDGVTSISTWAFYNGENIKNISIANSVVSIGDYAFVNCSSIETLSLGSGIKYIGRAAFWSTLSTVTYNGTEENWALIEIAEYNEPLLNAEKIFREVIKGEIDGFNYEFDAETGTLVIGGDGNMQDYENGVNDWQETFGDEIVHLVIADGVTSIGDFAFSGLSNVETITIPASVTDVGICSLNSSTLEAIYVDEDNESFTAHDGVLYSKDMTSLVVYPGGKTDEAFIIPEGVTTIEAYAFYYTRTAAYARSALSLVNDESEGALTSITISESVTLIKDFAFYGCDSLETVNYEGFKKAWNSIVIGTNNEALLNAKLICKFILGDVDGDGIVNPRDTINLKKLIAGMADPATLSEDGADLNGDGVVNSRDMLLLKKRLISE